MVALAGCAGTGDGQEDGASPVGRTGETTEAPQTLPVPDTALEVVAVHPRGTGVTQGLEVVAVYPRGAGFTQGLEVLDDGRLLHSRGRFGESRIEVVGLGQTEAEVAADLPEEHFGEGVTVVGDTAYQLTWQSGVVHTWTLPDLQASAELSIPGQGWGLCHDEGRGVLWLSDGSSTLQALAPADLAVQEVVQVQDGGSPVTRLNELECVEGDVWANIWHSDEVVRIDPGSGDVVQRVDLSELAAEVDADDPEHVLNGLAHDPADGTFLVTGKEWDRIFRVDLSGG
nr:glutaminyl-peptide cyclotransferase [Ornithinimicrobium sediminis]